VATFVDAERALAGWVNSLTGSLVGEGHPLVKGAHLHELRGAATSCYLLLAIVGSTTGLGAEDPDHRARLSGLVFGPTKESATSAAVAYANALLALDGRPVPMTGATCLVVDPDSITGPLWSPDRAGPRLLVDVDVYFRPLSS
jgi:hypothetical protein